MDVAGLFILLLAGLAIAYALSVLYVAYALTHPPRRGFTYAVSRGLATGPEAHNLKFTEWAFRSRGTDLPVWEIEGGDAAGPLVIATPGWGESRVSMLPRAAAIVPLCSRLILWDLPRHADVRGGRFTLGAREPEDLRGLIDSVAGSRREAIERPIVLYGFSLGGGVSIAAGVGDERIAGVIAESPYRLPQTPAARVMASRGFPHRFNLPVALWLLGHRFGLGSRFLRSGPGGAFDRCLPAAKLSVALTVGHGDADPICPVQDGREIAAAGQHGQFVGIPGGGHLDLWTDDRFRPLVITAIREALLRASSGPAAGERSPGQPVPPPSPPPPSADRS